MATIGSHFFITSVGGASLPANRREAMMSLRYVDIFADDAAVSMERCLQQ